MATVIDALVVTLGLDPKGVQKGGKEATTAFGKVTQGATKMGKYVSAGVDTAADSFRSLQRNALAFFAVLTAGKTLKAFISDTTSSNVAAGNLARNLGTSVQSLTTWQKATQAMGGTAEDVSSSMGALVSQFQTIEGRRNLGLVFGQLHVNLNDANGQLRSMNELIPDLAASAQQLGPQLFSALGGQAGFSQGFINLLEQGPEKVRALYQSLQKYAPTERDTKASAQLYEDWTKLTAQSEAFGRSIMTDLSPEVHKLFTAISDLIDANQNWLRQDIDKYMAKVGEALKNADWKAVGAELRNIMQSLQQIDWQAVVDGVSSFASEANSAAKFVGGWGKAVEYLFALWTLAKFGQVLANVRLLAAAMNPLLLLPASLYALIEGGEPSLAKDDTIPRKIATAPSVSKGGDFDVFAASIAQIEHAEYGKMGGAGGKYAGKYQMSQAAIADGAKRLRIPVPTQEQFLSNPDLQERIFKSYTAANEAHLNAYSEKFRNASPEEKLEILGYAHNQGATAAVNWLKTGQVGKDAFGTLGTTYSSVIHNNIEASHAAMRAVDGPSPSSANTSNVTNHITVNAPGGDPKAVTHAVKQAMGDLGFMARQSSIGLA